MVPGSFHDFFLGEAGASGALVGLLFVAISVSPERITGKGAGIIEQSRASSALTALLLPLTLALVGLLPDAQLGYPAIIVSAAGLLLVAATVRRLFSVDRSQRESPRGLVGLASFTAVLGFTLAYGIVALAQPHYTVAVDAIAAASIATLLLGVDRAWALIGGRDRGRRTSLVDLVRGEEEPSS